MTEKEMFNKIMELNLEFAQYALENPEILEEIPKDATLVFLPEDDPEFCKQNLRLARTFADLQKPLVTVKVKSLKPLKSRIKGVKLDILHVA